ncbi:tautomerase family protein [Priestia megaterium]|jgi:phenylpyruvate tautomerase PptA (4-oxalocrotonate tautomerase family)|uniref:tautomerase family protein n=1 Tax=Priestia TaxID=2800373 RepID=UPI000BEE13E0|nr:tautomerase family protein [Priestia megaterium]MED3975546.1 tautomerase family protein [Priestia megaterium]PEB62651.1 tautomerase family protein [Priestia megaterium]PEE75230.1 tautomerase family protein [Priestia megaterium]PFJ01288.1 tautomerase family protein [Priestia megaterium]PGR14032.1 tautomerase family protein [Priestia megaterium]
MPFVNVYYPEHQLNDKELKEVSSNIHQSLIQHFYIPKDDYFQLFLPYPSQHFFYDSQYLLERGEKRTDNMIYISITCGQGRTVEQKKKLYQSIAEGLSTHLNISTNNIFITLNETPLENWSFGQGIAQMMNQKEEK